MVNVGWLCSMRSEILLQMKFIIFQGCLTKQAAILPGQSSPWNQLLIQLLVLVQEGYFAKSFDSKVLKFQAHFSQNVVFIGCNIFSSSFDHLFVLTFAS